MDLQDFLSGDIRRDVLFTSLMPNPESEFCYSEIAPRIGVQKRDGKIGVITREDKIEDTSTRTDNVSAKDIGDMNVVKQPYNTEALDKRKFVSTGELNHNQVNSDVVKAVYSRMVVDKILRHREKRLVTKIQTAGNYASDHQATLSGTTQFTHASSKPVDTIVNYASTLYKLTGIMPDSLFFPWITWQAIITNANVKSEFAYVKDRVVTVQDLLPLLKTGALAGLQNIIIGKALSDTATKKDPKDKTLVTRDFMWADSMVIFKKASPITGTNLVEAGFVASVESEDPADLGYLEYEDTVNQLKGMYIEQRYSHDILNCGASTSYLDNGFLIIDTNG